MASGNTEKTGINTRRQPRFIRRKSAGDVTFDTFNVIFLILFCITILYPFWTIILLSFSPADEASSLGFHIWTKGWNINSYKYSLSTRYGNVPNAYFNSIFRTVIGTILILIVTLLAAYPLSKRNLPGRTGLTIYILITMFFSGGLIPTYLLVRSLGLIDSRWVLILPTLAIGFNIIIMRNFLMTLDNAYEESAFMDGANYFQILLRIVIPLSKPVIATVALWAAVRHWNSWFDALIYINSENKIVLQLVLRRMLRELTYDNASTMRKFMELENVKLPTQTVKAAITILTIGPIILFYPFLQKYFIKGVLLGSLKG